jgi:carboxypeptidase C (cathepsin A)
MTVIPSRDKRVTAPWRCLRSASLALLLAAFTPGLAGAQTSAPSSVPSRTAAEKPPEGAPEDSVTHQKFKAGGKEMAFTVTAGTLPLMDDGKRRAGMFYVAYIRDGQQRGSRPISFVFNGGPGASSAFLHLGALGPRIIDYGPDGKLPTPPGHLVDNPDTWLDLTDLVFLDPVGTGFSRAIDDKSYRAYWGVRQDFESIAQIIELYLSRNNRQTSPLYLIGESYGGLRGARLPQLLSTKHGIGVSGAFLISPVLEFSLRSRESLGLLPDAMALPSFAAVAMERAGTLSPDALAEVEHFALGPYLTAIANPRDAAATQGIYAKVARYIGLPEPLVAQYIGRVPTDVFVKETRRKDGLLISNYDGSASGPDPYPEFSWSRGGDVVYDGFRTVLTDNMAEYLSQVLGVRADVPYRVANNEVSRQWDWFSGLQGHEGYVGSDDQLRETLAANRGFKMVIAHGMTDLVTPYLVSRYLIDHLPPLLSDRVTLSLYPGGHMMYTRAASRPRLHSDAAKLFPPPAL